MAAPIGNEYYKIRTKDGRDRIFKSPEDLLNACNEYFQWVIDNPLMESQVVNRGSTTVDAEGNKTTTGYSIIEMPKMRPMTLIGLCNFIDIALNTFKEYEKRKDFLPVTTRIRHIIENHQFEGAASGFLNPNIIARALGLIDKREMEVRQQPPLFKTDE